MKLIAYDGWTFANDGYTCSIQAPGGKGSWGITAQIQPRLNTTGLLSGGQITPRVIPAEFAWSALETEANVNTLLAHLQPDNTDARLLIGQLNDNTMVQTYAIVQPTAPFDDTINSLPVAFTCVDPLWRKTTADTFGPQSWLYSGANALETPNAGKARSNLSLVLKPTAYDPGTVEFKYRRQFTVTNTSDTPLRQFPYEVDLGNSNGWGNTVTANFAKTWIFRDGLAVPRELIGWSEIQSYAWILVDDLAPGATATYDIAWEGINDAPGLTGSKRPGFDITWEKDNATAGGASTITKASATWRTDQWARGMVHILSGTGAGQNRKIASNTATVVTTVNTWTTNPDATSVFLLSMSHNDRWVYDVRQTSRSNSNRGLWYQNRGQSKPSNIVFDAPGDWYRTLVLDNNDEKNNSRTFAIDVGGGDIDYFNGLDADRTAQGWTHLQESGVADGVAFSSPIEIDAFRFDVAFKNPNAMCKATIGYRESGSEDWEEAYTDSTAHATLTAIAVQDIGFTTDIRHLAAYLGPVDDTEITQDWVRDTGSASAATSTTITDSTKSWAINQFAGATIRITAGTGAGQSKTVSSNTATVITVNTAWATNQTPSTDTRFEIKNPKLVSTLRHNTQWEVRLNTGKILQGGIGPQLTNYSLVEIFTVNGGPDAGVGSTTEAFPYQQLNIGTGNRKLFVASTEELRIDGAKRRAGVYRTSDGAFLRDVTNALLVRDVLAYDAVLGTYTILLAPDWLLVPPTPTNPLPNPDFASAVVFNDWGDVGASAGVTKTIAQDNTIFHLAAGSLKIDVTASTAAAGAVVPVSQNSAYTTFAKVTPGKAYTVTAWARKSGTNWTALLGIEWFTAAGASISVNFSTLSTALGYIHTTAAWWPIGYSMVAPSTAAYARVRAIAYEQVSSSVGTVWFDEIRWDTTALFMATQSAGVTADITASLTEGFYG